MPDETFTEKQARLKREREAKNKPPAKRAPTLTESRVQAMIAAAVAEALATRSPPPQEVVPPPWPVPDLDTFVAWCKQAKDVSARMITKHGHSWTSPVMRALLALRRMQEEQQGAP